MSTYWLVYYQMRKRHNSLASTDCEPMNVILQDVHPVKWAARRQEHYITYLLFFAQIPKEVAEDPSLACWCGAER